MTSVKEPLSGSNFLITSALMLHYGFKNILYESVNNDSYIDGWFYFKNVDMDRLEDFVKRLEEAHLSGLLHEFDDICLSLDRIILRKYTSPHETIEKKPKKETV